MVSPLGGSSPIDLEAAQMKLIPNEVCRAEAEAAGNRNRCNVAF